MNDLTLSPSVESLQASDALRVVEPGRSWTCRANLKIAIDGTELLELGVQFRNGRDRTQPGQSAQVGRRADCGQQLAAGQTTEEALISCLRSI
jgi:hypothetical protein